jgi:HEAT repeat protein
MDAQALQDVQLLASADAQQRSLALARLVAMGPRATDALLAALPASAAAVRPLLAQALAEVADARSAPALQQLLADADPQVRGRAAQGLAALRDPGALDALVRTINDLPDLLHYPYTVATQLLIARGPSALPAVRPLLQSADLQTRTRGWLVWRSIVEALPDVNDWTALWRQYGSYAPDAPQPQRDAAAAQWGQWLAARATSP